MRILSLCILLCLPFSAFAEGEFVTRRDAFLFLWDGIHRPAYESRESFADMSEGDDGSLEIFYAKERKILDDVQTFRPLEIVTLEDALLWLYRTRNVEEITAMREEDLPALVSRYPITGSDEALQSRVTMQNLIDMTRSLDAILAEEVHEVSFYAEDFHGRGTAFGETFDMNALTAAHRSFPHDTLVKVTNVENKESVIVRINDRGPYVDGRDMDLSKAAFGKIAHHGGGIIRATFERLGDNNLVDACEQRERSFQRRITGEVRFFRGIPHTFTIGDQLILQSNRTFVLQGITFPDGQYVRVQDFVHSQEKYRFTPDSLGMYVFTVGDGLGRLREMRMKVTRCELPDAVL